MQCDLRKHTQKDETHTGQIKKNIFDNTGTTNTHNRIK